VFFFQILNNRQRLSENAPAVFKRRNEGLRIDRFVSWAKLLAASSTQMDRHLLVIQAFQIERDPDTVRCGTAKESVKFHL